MNHVIILTAALLPVILLLALIWWKDPQKEPMSQLIKAVLWGVAICVPVAYAESLISNLLFAGGESVSIFGTTVQAFAVAGLVEESFKLLALWIVLRNNPYFDEHFDAIVYAVCVSLGFAAVENVFYVISSDAWAFTAVGRALLSVPGHYAFAVLMGYYYAVYHFVDHSPKAAANVLIMPVLAHGIYDALAMSGKIDPFLGLIAFVVLIYFCIRMHIIAYSKLMELIKKDTKTTEE